MAKSDGQLQRRDLLAHDAFLRSDLLQCCNLRSIVFELGAGGSSHANASAVRMANGCDRESAGEQE